MKLTWLGHSAFMIDDAILIDPWISNPKANLTVDDLPESVSLILVTHGHADHVGEAVEIAKKFNAPIIAVYELANLLQEEGAPEVIPVNVGGIVEVDDYLIQVVPAVHSSSYKGKYAGVPVGFVIETPEGIRIYHAGDTALFGDMRFIKADIALLPIGGTYTMDPYDAVEALKLIKPRVAIPMHYGTWDVIDVDETVFEDLAMEAGFEVFLMAPGESYVEEYGEGEEDEESDLEQEG